MEKFAEFLFVRFSFAVPLRADCMDGFLVPLVASSRSSCCITSIVASALLLRGGQVGSRVDIEELLSPAGQQLAHHSQTPHQDAVGPIVKRWQQGEKRPREVSHGETANRASGKDGAEQGGCSKVMKTGGCGRADSTIRVHGFPFGHWSSQSSPQFQESSVVPSVSLPHVDCPQDHASTVSSSLVSSRFKGPSLSTDHRPLNLVDSSHYFPLQCHKKRGSGVTAIDIAGNPDQIQGTTQSLIKDNESDPLQDKELAEVLEKMNKALANIREDNKRQDMWREKLKGEFESSLLEAE